ncbi:hypothetical protein F7725_002324 [Dissostichus mawsoni]|uniref:NADH dehydrogenase [ubiquinone] 1 alpha subcomplex subunit 10, mitochondrial n=1 Tax=Dissostichus mawsoni TaxID=36200 RepID=A0A7J5Y230_DISMA|nr:hypothetical protein F7725_002324 [Dissostichus mawsoni]
MEDSLFIMALRVIRQIVPSGAAALRAAHISQKAGVHTSSARSLQYGWLTYVMGERTMPRLTSTSKIITLDGNLASGKGALASKLADTLAGHPLHGQDDRGKEPLSADYNGMCSLEKFYMDPKAADGNSYRLQLWMYTMRLLQYADAIEHMLTTGQGVILERSPFSDFVFLDAMLQQGYIRKECVQHYNEIKKISLCEFLPPHVSIYIDVPAEEVEKKLKQSDKSYLHNVPLSYLKSIENGYKKTFLPKIIETSELLAYDANQALDFERVAEDIEYLKCEKGTWGSRTTAGDKHAVAALTHIPVFLPEITIGAHDYDEKFYAYKSTLKCPKGAQGELCVTGPGKIRIPCVEWEVA